MTIFFIFSFAAGNIKKSITKDIRAYLWIRV